MSESIARTERGFAALVTLAFSVLVAAGLASHELWKDETEPWSVALEAPSLAATLTQTPTQFHPKLWLLVLHVTSRVTRSPAAMQALHGAIATAAVWVFAAHAPFGRAARLLFALGYFPLFEYGVMSRNYSLGVLLLFCLCARLRAPGAPLWMLAGLTALMANTNAQMLAAAMVLAAAGAWQAIPGARQAAPATRAGMAVALATVGLAALFAWQALEPPAGSVWDAGWNLRFSPGLLALTATRFWNAFVPVPDMSAEIWWGTNFLTVESPSLDLLSARFVDTVPLVSENLVPLLGAGLIFTLAALCLADRPLCLAGWTLACAALLGMTYLKYFGCLRHHGHLFVFFLAALWLRDAVPAAAPFWGLLEVRQGDLARLRAGFLTSLLAVHAAVGLWALGKDLREPFSPSLESSRWIASRALAGTPIFAHQDHWCQSAAACLDRPFFSPQERKFIRFPSASGRVSPRTFVLEQAASDFARAQAGPSVLLLNRPLRFQPPGLKLLDAAAFEKSQMPYERHWVYLVEPMEGSRP